MVGISVVPLSWFLGNLVHPAAAGDRFTAVRHLAFIAGKAAAGTLAVAAMLVSLAVGGPRPLVEVGLFALLASELAIAAFLSRTGRLDVAETFSALALTALILCLAALSGGPRSTIVAWFALVPLDASLSGSRRALMTASAIAAFGFLGLLGVSRIAGYDVFARPGPGDLAIFTTTLGALVAISLAMRTGSVVFGIAGMAAEDAERAVPDPDAAPLQPATPVVAVTVSEPARLQAMIRQSMQDVPANPGIGATTGDAHRQTKERRTCIATRCVAAGRREPAAGVRRLPRTTAASSRPSPIGHSRTRRCQAASSSWR